ncbi:hypothetical protein LBMAG40_00380 [Cyanobium sp.]|jgi:hypothetical protein|nr:hypothetical protein LBMAG40_00380 [Cyanobium sp.]
MKGRFCAVILQQLVKDNVGEKAPVEFIGILHANAIKAISDQINSFNIKNFKQY